ncbi:alpha/beta hydrolase [Corynebacterium oculi]|uniref:Alpha/beta hydrolase family protein n=1 Tax=Corynebacterium oculi TaxID=1544416 RepID=A0A0Q1DYC7_9CORY|nr:alpha/beta hydrolase [Corynebacterium oculi]KQB85254.1 Alpha/beta hydrolase family protein [Corynebacterium oculi]
MKRTALGLALATALTASLAAPGIAQAAPSSSDIPILDRNITLPVPEELAAQGSTGVIATAPYNEPAGAIRTTFGQRGPHPVTATAEAHECTDLVFSIYNQILRFQHGVPGGAPCYDTFPAGEESPVGSKFIYPADIATMEKAPLVILSPGIGAEPGLVSRQAELYASHGYVVALGYSFVNWFGEQVERAAAETIAANQDPASPLFGKVDTSQTTLVGHSAGGGSVVRVSETLEQGAHAAGDNNFHVTGVVAVNPGPSDFGLASPATTKPVLFTLAENESLVPHPLSRMLYDRATGPKWWAVVNGSYHGTFTGDPADSVLGGLVLSFAEYTTTHSPRSTEIYQGEGLAQDSELHGVERAGV